MDISKTIFTVIIITLLFSSAVKAINRCEDPETGEVTFTNKRCPSHEEGSGVGFSQWNSSDMRVTPAQQQMLRQREMQKREYSADRGDSSADPISWGKRNAIKNLEREKASLRQEQRMRNKMQGSGTRMQDEELQRRWKRVREKEAEIKKMPD